MGSGVYYFKKNYTTMPKFYWFILMLILFSCKQNMLDLYAKEKALFGRFAASDLIYPEFQNVSFIPVLKSPFCIDNDCASMFEHHDLKVEVYSIEDLFMRGLSEYLIVKNIDTQEWSYMDISVHSRNEFCDIQILNR